MEGKRAINSIGLRNVLSFGSKGQRVELQPLNVLIGPNASGKSNFIEVFRLLQALPGKPERIIREGGGITEWLWKGDEAIPKAWLGIDTELIAYSLEFTKAGYRWQIVDEYIGEPIDPDNPPFDQPNFRSSIESEPWGFDGEFPSDISLLAIMNNHQPEGALAKLFSSIGVYKDWNNSRFSLLKSPHRPDMPSTPLLEDLSNFSLVFNNLSYRTKSAIIEQLNQVCEGVEEIITQIEGGTVQTYFQEKGLSSATPLARVSDGTLRYLFMLTLLNQKELPPLICLEEPETGLHPDVIHSVAQLLVEASQRTQLIVTTHSSSLVSALSDIPESVIVCERESSSTILRRLDRESLEGWLERYELGELWEKGVIGGTR